MTAYIAHKRVDGTEQKLKDHLNNVASLAAAFASPFSAESDASLAGWLHDLGKYGVTSQRHMQDPEHTRPCDHSTAGLQKAIQLKRLAVAFAVAGHHAGLPDRGSKVDSQAEATLCGRNARKIEDTSVSFQDGICLDIIDPLPAWTTSLTKFDLQFYIRMLFSCLVDADYLDTEAFLQPDLIGRGLGDSMDIIEKRFLSSTFDKWKGAQPGTLNAIRTKIFEACYTYALPESGLASLSVPTGGGKTAASFALAVKNCMDYGKKRIIYVIPYTSIIEQNAALFRQWIGNQNVVEHHSGIQPDRLDDEERTRWQLACENWDAPVIITTSVQFFDSLFACRPGKCRKLHNIADSVVIFDEVQMMPLQCLRPCIGAIVALTKHYRVTAVLCTATQPALESSPNTQN